MAARKKPTKPKKKAPAKRPTPKRRPAAKPRPKARARAKTAPLMPVPDSREEALAWFANLANRVMAASVAELQTLIAEARRYDLVGLGEVFDDEQQVLELNRAANTLVDAAVESMGAATPQGLQLQILRDILNDS